MVYWGGCFYGSSRCSAVVAELVCSSTFAPQLLQYGMGDHDGDPEYVLIALIYRFLSSLWSGSVI